MTIASELNRVAYDGTGALTPLAVSYPFHATTDLVVVETVKLTGVSTTLAIITDYDVTGTPDSLGHYSNGGTVTPVIDFPVTVRWTIYRSPIRLQELDLTNNDNFPSESVEAQFDYLTMLVQRIFDLTSRSLRQPDGDSANIAVLPSLVDRLGKYLYFDETTGDGTAVEAVEAVAIVPTTWTPTVTFGTPGNLSVAYAFRQGQVIKIGQFVHITGFLIFTPTFTTASGQLAITGCPYGHSGNADANGACIVNANVDTNYTAFVATINSAGTVIIQGQNTAFYSNLLANDFTTAVEATIKFGMSFIAAS